MQTEPDLQLAANAPPPTATASLSPDLPVADPDLEQTRVLVVDDNKFARLLIRNLLHAVDIRDIVVTDSAVDALQILARETFDLALIDFEMPILDGAEFTRRVRSGDGILDRELPIIMISSYTEENRVVEARDAGVHEYMAKPLPPTDLYSRIEATLNNPRPFVRTDSYVGPERRDFNKAAPKTNLERRAQ